MFVIVVAEEVGDPCFGGQTPTFAFREHLRREALGSNEQAEGRFEGVNIKAFARLKLDRSYPETSKNRDGSPDHAISSPAARDPYFDRPRHVETEDFEPEQVEIQPVPMKVGDESVGVVFVRATALSTLPNVPLNEVGKAGFEMKLEEETQSGGCEPVVSRVLVALIHNKLRDSATRKEDRVGLSIWKLDRLLKTAADPKNPLRIGEWIKFLERER